MGQNGFKNLSYAAVALIVAAVCYLVYQNGKAKKNKLAAQTELNSTASTDLSSYPDTSLSVASSPGATASSQTGYDESSYQSQPITGNNATSVSTTLAEPLPKEVEATEPGDIVSSAKSGKTMKSPAVSNKPKPKFDPGTTSDKGEFMVIAGAFNSSDNAALMVNKLKKQGFKYAEVVKMDHSPSTYAVAAYYTYKATADAAVRTLQQSKISSYVKKKAGGIYKPATQK